MLSSKEGKLWFVYHRNLEESCEAWVMAWIPCGIQENMETKLQEKHYRLPSPFGLKSEKGRYAGKFVLLLELLDEAGRFFEG